MKAVRSCGGGAKVWAVSVVMKPLPLCCWTQAKASYQLCLFYGISGAQLRNGTCIVPSYHFTSCVTICNTAPPLINRTIEPVIIANSCCSGVISRERRAIVCLPTHALLQSGALPGCSKFKACSLPMLFESCQTMLKKTASSKALVARIQHVALSSSL